VPSSEPADADVGARGDAASAVSPAIWRRPTFWLGLLIFVAAAALRVALNGTARFSGDEWNDWLIGLDIARGRNFPLLGPLITSGPARHPGPAFYWLVGFAQLFSKAPEAGYLLFELLGAATVWLFWMALRRPFGEAAAAFAGFLLAFSPWSALLGDRVWNPHGFLFFEGLALLAAVRLREDPRSPWLLVLPGACLALPHFHMSAPVVWLALVPLVAGGVRRWRPRYVALGVALALLLYVPLAIHELKTGFGNTRAFWLETFSPKRKTPFSTSFLEVPLYVVRLLSLDTTYHELTGYWGGLDEGRAWHALWHGSEARPFHPARLVTLLASFALLVTALLVVGRAAWARARRDGARSALNAFGVAGVAAVLLDMGFLGLTKKQIFGHYVSPTLPFVFVLYAAAAARLWRSPRARAALVGLGVLFAAGGIEATLSISRRIDARLGLATHRAVLGRIYDDIAATGGPANAPPVHLRAEFLDFPYAHQILASELFRAPLRWTSSDEGLSYVLRKHPMADASTAGPMPTSPFPVTSIGSIDMYRLH
jgi:hypothetical protein